MLYCRAEIRAAAGCVDHFIPWARYPVDLGHNFVLAHDSCNGAKGMMLAAADHLAAWAERNARYGDEIEVACGRAGVAADLSASVQIARWAYRQAFETHAQTWVRKKLYAPLTAEWQRVLVA